METKQLNSFRIDFYSTEEWNKVTIPNEDKSEEFTFADEMFYEYNFCKNIYYAGLVSNITKELAEEIVKKEYNKYMNYKHFKDNKQYTVSGHTTKEHLQVLSNHKFCVITKI